MADRTGIEWTDATWNPITGCSVVSAGCKHCYAMKLAGTRLAHHPSRAGLTIDTKAGPVWTGEVRFNEQWLHQPMSWRRPRRIFVCAHGDLFHEAVPDAWIDMVFAVMALSPQHQFQVLTKRADRMRDYLADPEARDRVVFHAGQLAGEANKRGDTGMAGLLWTQGKAVINHPDGFWPLRNVWLGVSVEDQAAADERIRLLLQCPAAVRWISAEPLLGEIDLRQVRGTGNPMFDGYTGFFDALRADRCAVHARGYCLPGGCGGRLPALDWVVAGGESGPGARPMHPAWARSLRDQCAAAGVAFMFKQWGEWLPGHHYEDEHRRRDADAAQSRYDCAQWNGKAWDIGTPHTLDIYDHDALYRVGKKAAGRLLDGVQHDSYPGGA